MSSIQFHISKDIDIIPKDNLNVEFLICQGITKLPDNLDECYQLKTLEISLSDIDTIKYLPPTLNGLYIEGCDFTEIPECVQTLNLNHLRINDCPIKNIPDFFGSKSFEYINLNNCDIRTIPESFKNCNVKDLSLENNLFEDITNIPKSVEMLNVSNCSINNLDSLVDYKNLEYLIVHNNNITTVGTFEGCDNLLKVNVRDNPIKSVEDTHIELNICDNVKTELSLTVNLHNCEDHFIQDWNYEDNYNFHCDGCNCES